MTLKQKKILELLSKNPNGLKASEIANKLNITRREVNQFLYSGQTDYVNIGEPCYKWVRNTGNKSQSFYSSSIIKKEDPVLSKLSNRKGAKVFTSKQFNTLANWQICKSHTGKKPLGTYKTKTGNLIEYDSKPELQLLKYLEAKKLVLEIGGQNLCIPYDSVFRKNLPYYPDFVILKNDGHIAIIEVKSIMAMSYHKNIEKYNALKSYSAQHGFEYMMIAPDHNYMTFEELSQLNIPKELSLRIASYLRNSIGKVGTVLLEKEDIPILGEYLDDICRTQKELELYLHAIIIQKGWYNKFANGFMVYEKPQK